MGKLRCRLKKQTQSVTANSQVVPKTLNAEASWGTAANRYGCTGIYFIVQGSCFNIRSHCFLPMTSYLCETRFLVAVVIKSKVLHENQYGTGNESDRVTLILRFEKPSVSKRHTNPTSEYLWFCKNEVKMLFVFFFNVYYIFQMAEC